MNQRYKKFLKVFVIIFIAIVGLFVFSRGAEAAFSCDSGSTSTTCYITGAKTMTNGETVTGTGNLVIGATISSATSTDIVYFDFGGNITIGTSTAGSITTNFQATSTNFTINSNGSINVTGKGCAGGAVEISGQGGGSSCSAGGTGAGVGNAISGGGGGGHGAWGGDGASGGAGGGTYDSITQPVLLGSGGGGGNNTAGGAGGGAIKIIISGTITINGAIIANGNTGTNSGSAGADTGGGGSGGSVWIQAGTLAGSSNITASGSKGGNSTAIGSGQYTGGGGAGGRIAVYYTNSSYSGTLTVSGAAGGTNSGTGGTGGTGGAGTVYQEDTFNNTATINNGVITPTDFHTNITQITIEAGSTVSFDSFATSTNNFPALTTLTVNGTLTHSAGSYLFFDSTTAPNLATVIINSGGSINVTGKGCAGGAVEISGQGGGSSCSAGGTGAGVGNAISGGGGGGHGASGGDGASGGAGGGTYDSITKPVLLGSGGGGGNNTAGGAGGGAIKIIISGTITINGAIIANGNTGTNSGSTGADTGGGGSGGSVWIQA